MLRVFLVLLVSIFLVSGSVAEEAPVPAQATQLESAECCSGPPPRECPPFCSLD